VKARLLEAVADFRDVGQPHRGAGGRGDHFNASEFLGPLLALFHAQEDFPGVGFDGAGGDVLARLLDESGDLSEGQAVFSKRAAWNFHMGDVVGRAPDLDLRDGLVAQKAVAKPFRQYSKRHYVHGAVEADFHDVPLGREQADFGLLDVFGKGSDPVHRLVDVLKGLHAIGAGHQFDANGAGTFAGGGRNLLDALHASDRLLDGKQNALLDLGRRGARVDDADFDHVQGELGKDLLLDREGRVETATDDDCHEEVRGDGIAGHPGDGTLARSVLAGGAFAGDAHSTGSPPAAAREVSSSSSRSGAPSTTVERLVVTTWSPSSRPLDT